MKHSKKITFPTYFTLLRLLGAPILVPFLLVRYLPFNDIVINSALAFLFLLFGFTDFLDGFFARKYQQESKLGATLDHLADKFLTFCACVGLLAIGKMSYIVVLLLIGREIFMMGLREIALENDIKIKVSAFGKIKTCVQIMTIAWIIINPYQHESMCNIFNSIELMLVFASVLLAWYSAWQYCIVFYQSLKN